MTLNVKNGEKFGKWTLLEEVEDSRPYSIFAFGNFRYTRRGFRCVQKGL